MKRNVLEHHYHSFGLNVCKFIIHPKQLGINIKFTHIIFHAGIVMKFIPRNDILYGKWLLDLYWNMKYIGQTLLEYEIVL